MAVVVACAAAAGLEDNMDFDWAGLAGEGQPVPGQGRATAAFGDGLAGTAGHQAGSGCTRTTAAAGGSANTASGTAADVTGVGSADVSVDAAAAGGVAEQQTAADAAPPGVAASPPAGVSPGAAPAGRGSLAAVLSKVPSIKALSGRGAAANAQLNAADMGDLKQLCNDLTATNANCDWQDMALFSKNAELGHLLELLLSKRSSLSQQLVNQGKVGLAGFSLRRLLVGRVLFIT